MGVGEEREGRAVISDRVVVKGGVAVELSMKNRIAVDSGNSTHTQEGERGTVHHNYYLQRCSYGNV